MARAYAVAHGGTTPLRFLRAAVLGVGAPVVAMALPLVDASAWGRGSGGRCGEHAERETWTGWRLEMLLVSTEVKKCWAIRMDCGFMLVDFLEKCE